jgi:hypothetical protein
MRPTASFTLCRALLPVLTAVSIACGNQAKPPAAAPAESPASAAVAPAAGVPMVTNFGVPECDAYVSKYMACVEGRVTGEAKDQLLATFEANRTKWRAMSTMREGAVALGLACRAALQKAKEELVVDYGCEF